MSTFPAYNDSLSVEAQYWLSLAAQAINGLGNPVAVSLPTKVRKIN